MAFIDLGSKESASRKNAEKLKQEIPPLAAIIDEAAQAAANAEGMLDYASEAGLSAHIENIFRRVATGPAFAITGIVLKTREPYKEHVLSYLGDLTAAGVTPDVALEFIAECEVPNNPDALGAFSRGLNEISEQVTTFLRLPAIQDTLLAAINDVLKSAGLNVGIHFGTKAGIPGPFPIYPPPPPSQSSVVADAGVVMDVGEELRDKAAGLVEDIANGYLPEEMRPMPYDEMWAACDKGMQNCDKCPDINCGDNTWFKDLVRDARAGLTGAKAAGVIVAIASQFGEQIPFTDPSVGEVFTDDKDDDEDLIDEDPPQDDEPTGTPGPVDTGGQ